MKISASEAQWNTCQPCSFSLFQIGGFTEDDQTPSFSIEIPRMLSFLATGSFDGKVQGLNELNKQYKAKYGRESNYLPPVEVIYWSMRAMAYAGSLRRPRRRRRRPSSTGSGGSSDGAGSSGSASSRAFFPFIATTAGWVLTEMGRQPWIVQGLLKTADANSPSVSTTWLVISLTVFVAALRGARSSSTSG